MRDVEQTIHGSRCASSGREARDGAKERAVNAPVATCTAVSGGEKGLNLARLHSSFAISASRSYA